MPASKPRLERIALSYDPRKDFDYHLIRFATRVMERRLRGPRVLEVGCASGVMTEWLAGRGGELTVIEGSARYIALVKRLLRRRRHVEYVHTLWESYVPERPFDDIVMAHALEHIPDPVSLLKKMQGWAKASTRLHLIVPNAGSLHRRAGVRMGLLKDVHELNARDRRVGHVRVYDRELLARHLRAAGWRIEGTHGVFLKPLSNAQLLEWDEKLVEAYYELGFELPEYCSELYAVCRPA